MSTEEHKDSKLLEYLYGELGDDDKKHFESQMAQDTDLAREVSAFTELRETLSHLEEEPVPNDVAAKIMAAASERKPRSMLRSILLHPALALCGVSAVALIIIGVTREPMQLPSQELSRRAEVSESAALMYEDGDSGLKEREGDQEETRSFEAGLADTARADKQRGKQSGAAQGKFARQSGRRKSRASSLMTSTGGLKDSSNISQPDDEYRGAAIGDVVDTSMDGIETLESALKKDECELALELAEKTKTKAGDQKNSTQYKALERCRQKIAKRRAETKETPSTTKKTAPDAKPSKPSGKTKLQTGSTAD